MIFGNPGLHEWLVAVRRDFHMYPELSHQELRTTQRILEILRGLPIEAKGLEGMTGALGLIRGSATGPTLGLRADIDALPIQELNDVAYRSRHEGVMHACGHDAHTAIMLGVAKHIVESGLAGRIRGNIKFLFQPAEERVTGARAMIAQGVLENPNVDRVIAGHMDTTLPVGTVGIFRTQGYASADWFTLKIAGKGAHGGRPHEGIDPIMAGSYFVTALQSVVGKNIDPRNPAVITVGKFVAGSAGNVIPETAELEGTIRALNTRVRDQLIKRLREITAGMKRTFHVGCDFRLHEGVPSCINNEEVSTFMHSIAVELLGPRKVRYREPIMAAEDFAYFAMERPSAIIRLGCVNPRRKRTVSLHSPHFDIDEEVLSVGVGIFTRAVERYLT
jgi:amidohydrolase